MSNDANAGQHRAALPRFQRRAEWIWRPRGLGQLAFANSTPPFAAEENLYVYFRKTLDCPDIPTQAAIYLSADARYQLFVNGQFVGRGPARCNPQWQGLDHYDIAPHMRAGRNVLAVLVHSYGRNTASYELPTWEQGRAFGCGGLFVQGDIGGQRCDSDGSWRCLVSDAWQRNTPFGSLGFMEVYDARYAPLGWTADDFDDSNWSASELLRVRGRNTTADVTPFPLLVPRTIPFMREELALPRAVVRCGEVVNSAADLEVSQRLFLETLQERYACRVDNLASLLSREGAVEITTSGDRSVSIVVDFGAVIAGYVHLDLEGRAGAVVEFTYGERLEPDGRVMLAEGIPGFDARPGHRYTLREGRQSWERFAWNGFRYLQVTLRHCTAPLRLFALAANLTSYPVEPRGRFTCSDDLLNQIWQACRYTAQLSMHDGYIDCPGREQRQWVGDSYIQSLLTYVAFGDTRLIAQFLRHAAQSQRANGLAAMAAPGDFAATTFTNIPDFTLHWILAIHVYHQYTADLALVADLYPSLVKALAWFAQFVNDDDLLTDAPHWVFIDWAELDKTGQVTALNAHYVAALRCAAELARLLQTSRDAEHFDARAARVAAAINHLLWDEERGVYVDARDGGRQSRRVSQHANAAAIAFGVAPQARWPRMLAAVLDPGRLVLTRGIGANHLPAPPFDEERNVVLAQPFYMHFVHRALQAAGRHQPMLDNIRHHWAPMVADGGATIWECWQLTPIASMCHAFSATPLFDLSSVCLGVTPLEPGFRRACIAPQPAGLAWARGAFPTPHGEIVVHWQLDHDCLRLTVSLPEPIEADLLLPDGSLTVIGPGTHEFQSKG